jgi:hypothetical protein
MRCSGQKLDTFGRRESETDAQPVASPDEKTVGCNLTCMDAGEGPRFSINQCESHVKSDLATVSLNIDSRDTRKLKFLIAQEPKFP